MGYALSKGRPTLTLSASVFRAGACGVASGRQHMAKGSTSGFLSLSEFFSKIINGDLSQLMKATVSRFFISWMGIKQPLKINQKNFLKAQTDNPLASFPAHSAALLLAPPWPY